MTFDPTVSINLVKLRQYKHFSCGDPQLDEYLKRFAKANEKKGIGRNFLLLSDDQFVIGYYTLCMAHVEFRDLPISFQQGLPKYPLPAARLCRLAVDQKIHGQGIGQYLLMDAIERVITADRSVAAHSLIVDAKNAKTKCFYLKHDFISLHDQDLKLFLPLATLRSL